MHALIYDIEIIKAIPDRNGVKLEGIEYCEGWGDHANMGISVIGAYDYQDQRYRVFCEDNITEFYDICEERLLVGFNNKGFDDKVLSCRFPNEYKDKFLTLPRYDILAEIRAALGAGNFVKGYGLDPVCEKNFGIKKTGNGALAPVLWQQGRRGQTIDYCLNDVYMTKRLFDKIVHESFIVDPTNNHPIQMRLPIELIAA